MNAVAPVARRPLSHVVVLPAAPKRASARVRTPITPPPCHPLAGHFPTPTTPCFYGCEVRP